MNPSKKILIFCCWAFAGLAINAQKYQSNILREIAKKVTLTVPSANVIGYVEAGAYHGMPLVLALDNTNTITHIGYHLFPTEMKTLYSSDVYDFIERYLLQLDCLDTDALLSQRLSDDKVLVTGGSLKNLHALTQDIEFSINRTEDKFYEVAWTKDGNTLLSLAFPIQFELLLGMPKVEIEKKFRGMVMSSQHLDLPKPSPLLKPLNDSIYETDPIKNYYVESCNTASYYCKVDSQYIPCFDNGSKWYSAANLFQGAIQDDSLYTLYVQQNLYGFETTSFSLPLVKWLDYCGEQQLEVYFAIEEEHEDGLKALLIAHSKDMGFNHLLSIIIPDNFIDKRNATFKATLNAFIPTQNIKDLYQHYQTKKRKRL